MSSEFDLIRTAKEELQKMLSEISMNNLRDQSNQIRKVRALLYAFEIQIQSRLIHSKPMTYDNQQDGWIEDLP